MILGIVKKLCLKIKSFLINVFQAFLWIFVATPFMMISSYQMMKEIEKDLEKKKKDELNKN